MSDADTPGQDGVSVAVQLLAACAVVALLQFAAPLLLPIVVSALLFYALDPIVDHVSAWRVPRALASIGVLVAVLGVIALGATLVWPQVDSVITRIPSAATQLRTALRDNKTKPQGEPSTIQKVQEAATALDKAVAEAGATETTRTTPVVEVQETWHASDWLWAGGVGILGLVGQSITVLFLTLFMLIEDDSFKRKLVHQMETIGSKRVTVQILNDIEHQIERFIWVQALTSAGVAVVTGLTLMYLGVDAPAVWGLFAGLMNIVPYFGPLVVTAVLCVVGFLQFGTLEMAAVVAGAALAITTFEGMILTPHLLSRATSLNHVAIFVALAFWSWAWGVPGMLLAVPILVTVKAVCDHVEGFKSFGEFLGD